MKKQKLHPEVVKYLKEGMLFGNGMKIDITYRKGEKIYNLRELMTDTEVELADSSLMELKIKRLIFELMKTLRLS